MRLRSAVVTGLAVASALASASARADSNDLTLERIVGPPTSTNPVELGDNTIPANLIRNTQYKSLMSEMGVVMAPRYLAPSDTLGYSGFQVAFEAGFTQISNHSDFWQKGVEHVSGQFLETISVMARKGIWLPLPAFEIGAGATKLIGANMFAVQAYAKFALHEGFHDWPIPSLAVRAGVSRVVGEPQIDLTVLTIDTSVSKSFGLGGTVRLDPYLGFAALMTWARGQVIDSTPNVDAYTQGPQSLDLNENTTFPDPAMILRWQVFGGFRLKYSILALTGEFIYTLCNDSGSHCGDVNTTKVVDRSGGQAIVNLSGSLIF
jgi:hypothetical protein